jgi:hypothetical protein
MSEKCLVIISSGDGKISKEKDKYQVLEIGAKDRLRTYYNGVIKGFQMAGYKANHGHYSTFCLLKKEDMEFHIYLMTVEEWQEF